MEREGVVVSFSSDAKLELIQASRDPSVRPCCRAAEAYGMLELGRAFSLEEISLHTENVAVAEWYRDTLQTVCNVPQPEWIEQGNGYLVRVTDPKECQQVLDRFGHTGQEISIRLNRANFECEDCMPAYLRGAFLACGAIANPESSYHLELDVPYYNLSRDLRALIGELGLAVKYICRKGNHVLYFKESEQIEDCLTIMGATKSSLKLMDIKILKSIRNTANRIANCENANIDKIVSAATAQVAAIRKIEEAGKLSMLPPELQTVARLRMDNPTLSLAELAERMPEPISRSGLNHRLKRIMEFADTI